MILSFRFDMQIVQKVAVSGVGAFLTGNPGQIDCGNVISRDIMQLVPTESRLCDRGYRMQRTSFARKSPKLFSVMVMVYAYFPLKLPHLTMLCNMMSLSVRLATLCALQNYFSCCAHKLQFENSYIVDNYQMIIQV